METKLQAAEKQARARTVTLVRINLSSPLSGTGEAVDERERRSRDHAGSDEVSGVAEGGAAANHERNATIRSHGTEKKVRPSRNIVAYLMIIW